MSILARLDRPVAVLYYLLNMRATIKLGDPIYYNKSTWVALVRQVSVGVDVRVVVLLSFVR